MGVREVRELVKIEEARVNSVAEEGWCWTVHENSSKMTITATTQTSLVKGIIPLMLCSDLINFIKNYLFVFSCDNSIDRSPESGIPWVWLELMVVCEESCITDNAVVETRRKLVPKFTRKGSFHCMMIEQVLLKGRKDSDVWKGLLVDYRLGGNPGEF